MRTKLEDGISQGHGKRVTRKEVAKAANVSLATVTYALSGSGKIRIGAETCARVRRVAKRLGYRPNYVRRALAAGRTYAIGLVVPSQRSLLFPLYELIIDGCCAKMNADNFDPLLLSLARPERIATVVRDGRVDGLFILQSNQEDTHILRAAEMGLPMVVLNRSLPAGIENARVGCAYSDHLAMMANVVDELVALGCRRLLNFTKETELYAFRQSAEGFAASLVRHAASGIRGDTVSPVWVHSKPQVDGLFAQGLRWDGIFVTGSPATGALLAAAEARGFKVGRDFQLIVTDAFPETESYDGTESHVRRERTVYWQQPQLVGAEGWRLMKAIMTGAQVRSREIRVPYRRVEIGGVDGMV